MSHPPTATRRPHPPLHHNTTPPHHHSTVIDKGCGSVLIIFLLTLAGWIPGVIAALIILNKGG